MVFIMGMYWWARSPETERMRMRGLRGGWEGSVVVENSGGPVVVEGVVRERETLFM